MSDVIDLAIQAQALEIELALWEVKGKVAPNFIVPDNGAFTHGVLTPSAGVSPVTNAPRPAGARGRRVTVLFLFCSVDDFGRGRAVRVGFKSPSPGAFTPLKGLTPHSVSATTPNVNAEMNAPSAPAAGVSPVTNGNTVFRVQDKDGRGPWKPGFSERWVEDRPEEEFAALKPWPMEFGNVLRGAIVGMSLGCGCRSLEQLRRWFTPTEYQTLRDYGYRAVKLEAGRILAESDIQCVFERAKPLWAGAEPVELYPAVNPNAGVKQAYPRGRWT